MITIPISSFITQVRSCKAVYAPVQVLYPNNQFTVHLTVKLVKSDLIAELQQARDKGVTEISYTTERGDITLARVA